jgi:hypothetical protein
MRSIRTLAAFAGFILIMSGCATPVGVSRLDQTAANRKLEANVLSTGRPSAFSTQVLERTALRERYKEDPEAALAQLKSIVGKPGERNRLFALSELSFAYAGAAGDQSYYLVAAATAYAFLFPRDPAAPPELYDPRRQIAMALYNRGIALGLATSDGSEVDLSERDIRLPFGVLSLRVNLSGFTYAGNRLVHFVKVFI